MKRLAAHRLAAAAALLLGGYLQVVEWIDLYPWNNIRAGNGQAGLDLALAAATLALAAALWVSQRWAPLVASAALSLWAWLQAVSWWVPYVRGASPGWRRFYAHWFAGTVQALPGDATHLPPDANHLVLQMLILLALAACLAAAARGFARHAG